MSPDDAERSYYDSPAFVEGEAKLDAAAERVERVSAKFDSLRARIEALRKKGEQS
jgi:hypothetical protein